MFGFGKQPTNTAPDYQRAPEGYTDFKGQIRAINDLMGEADHICRAWTSNPAYVAPLREVYQEITDRAYTMHSNDGPAVRGISPEELFTESQRVLSIIDECENGIMDSSSRIRYMSASSDLMDDVYSYLSGYDVESRRRAGAYQG